jgi:putative FmdB family regulatory protein
MPIFDFECQCGNMFERILKADSNSTKCDLCGEQAIRIFPQKSPTFKLKYNPKTDMVDWEGNSSQYWKDYKKMKDDGKNPRIPALDGE